MAGRIASRHFPDDVSAKKDAKTSWLTSKIMPLMGRLSYVCRFCQREGSTWKSTLMVNDSFFGKSVVSAFLGGEFLPDAHDLDDGPDQRRLDALIHHVSNLREESTYEEAFREAERDVSRAAETLRTLHASSDSDTDEDDDSDVACARYLFKERSLVAEQARDGLKVHRAVTMDADKRFEEAYLCHPQDDPLFNCVYEVVGDV